MASSRVSKKAKMKASKFELTTIVKQSSKNKIKNSDSS